MESHEFFSPWEKSRLSPADGQDGPKEVNPRRMDETQTKKAMVLPTPGKVLVYTSMYFESLKPVILSLVGVYLAHVASVHKPCRQ